MPLMITNDDGIEAPGIQTLVRAASSFASCIIVAPNRQHSGSGHCVSDDDPVQIEEHSVNEYAISGTPADCTRIGLSCLASDSEWVLAGINAGGNLGCDVFMSGTVAAVREAALMGTRAIAFSQYREGMSSRVDWSQPEHWTRRVLERLIHSSPGYGSLNQGEFWNVNFPDPSTSSQTPDIIVCPVDVLHYQFEYERVNDGLVYRGNYQQRPRTAGCDIEVCFNGQIAVSKLSICSNAGGLLQ